MTVHALFPTLVHSADLPRSASGALNRQLLRECQQLRADDAAGRRWSEEHYPNGYTSYDSASRMHRMSPTFAALEKRINRHVAAFARRLDFDLEHRKLEMTDCWVNIMSHRATHGLHLHPLATVSGTYYVQVPRGSPGLKFEDPRLDRFMATPPRRGGSRSPHRPWIVLPANPGRVLLFESWLRHEVASNPARGERVSISFNYGWF